MVVLVRIGVVSARLERWWNADDRSVHIIELMCAYEVLLCFSGGM
jgi:hypothetical protein